MLSLSHKIKYLVDAARRYGEKVACTHCGGTDCKKIDRKYIFTRLFECSHCHMYFRHPVEKQEQNRKFYQDDYQEMDNVTATLPATAELEVLKQEGFAKGNKNAGRYLEIFSALFPQQQRLRIIDYGSSWGYISWQLKNAGHDVQSFEISKPRAAYGNNHLGLDIRTSENELEGGCDIFFSSHVIEHHPSIPSMIDLARRLMRPDGFFIAISPNGSDQFRQRHPDGFHHALGKVHPNFLNARFYETVFKAHDYYIGSSPINLPGIAGLALGRQITDTDLSGEELIVISRINISNHV